MDQDEVERQEQEWESQTVVRSGFRDDDVSDMQGDMLLSEATYH
jgi:hypothetical protein